MPQVVGDLRGHRHEAAAAQQVREEELAQALRDQHAVARGELRMARAQLREQARREHEAAHEGLAPVAPHAGPEDRAERGERDDDEQGGQHGR